jgi:intraflagellar transport protein 140
MVMMRDFLNMGKIDNATKIALLDFSYNLTLGKLDEAYRSVKSINNPSLWENMAQMCIKTKRIDVAEICLSQMGHARGAAALRDSKKENNLEVSAGVLAIQLGFFDDAIKLFKEAKRYDLVNKLLQSSGKYEKAVKTSIQHDHLHINTTHTTMPDIWKV